MATVAAIFDDSVALERAISRLESAGLGDDIEQITEGRDASTAPEGSETPDEPDRDTLGVGVPAIAGAGGLSGGGSGTQSAAPLLGGLLGGRDGGGGLGRLDSLGAAAEPFRLAARQGGKVIVLETDDVDTAVSTLRAAGAQQVYDPR